MVNKGFPSSTLPGVTRDGLYLVQKSKQSCL
jgi:hypothetical protein